MSNLIRCQNGHMFSSRRYGTVCPYCNIETATKEKKETGQTDVDVEELLFLEDVQPVCGWIVCISGPRQGKDYKIKNGKNFIGRADDMDIQILGDNKISRRNHGIIVFDPKKKEMVLLPGESNGIVYLQGDAVYTPKVLNTYDVIELGDSKFLFIPFCGEQFNWEDVKKPKDTENSAAGARA
ncbi:FHA domain-containing protein [Pelosinus baikalensis]|uniref:FHA domain-containing protein n=1 Tax=Pelosinus baikalensis TaxID=2892015 RepID=A0ABS8HL02_9FIRM|nr:FHA domain-containing protein [Pelosinus baikalensis]MCC5463804.1 FHA domain-containing protein [Pelosinus baikalensis]